MSRSTCSVRVGACLVDEYGRIFSWGWNSMGPHGLGLHAEAHAICRANHQRLLNSTLYVASVRARNNLSVTSKPCIGCQILMQNLHIHRALWREKDNTWHELLI